MKKIFDYLKYDRNSFVFSELNMLTPGIILINEMYRIDSELCVVTKSNSWAWLLKSCERLNEELSYHINSSIC